MIQGSLSDSVTWALTESDIKNCRPRVLGRRTMITSQGWTAVSCTWPKQRMVVFFRLGLLAGLSRKLSVGLAGRNERKGFNAVKCRT